MLWRWNFNHLMDITEAIKTIHADGAHHIDNQLDCDRMYIYSENIAAAALNRFIRMMQSIWNNMLYVVYFAWCLFIPNWPGNQSIANTGCSIVCPDEVAIWSFPFFRWTTATCKVYEDHEVFQKFKAPLKFQPLWGKSCILLNIWHFAFDHFLIYIKTIGNFWTGLFLILTGILLNT